MLIGDNKQENRPLISQDCSTAVFYYFRASVALQAAVLWPRHETLEG